MLHMGDWAHTGSCGKNQEFLAAGITGECHNLYKAMKD